MHFRKTAAAKPWQQPAAPPAATASAPARPAGIISDVLVPILQAAITGAGASGLVTYIVHRALPDWTGTFDLFVILGLVIGCAAWILLLIDHQKLLWAIERVFQADLNHDGAVADPKERIVRMNPGQAKREVEKAQAQADASRFRQFVTDLKVHPTDSRFWEPRIGRDTYNSYRDALMDMGWADWNVYGRGDKPNKRKGWSLTVDVDTILSKIQD